MIHLLTLFLIKSSPVVKVVMEDLKSNVQKVSSGHGTNTIKALDNFNPDTIIDPHEKLMADISRPQTVGFNDQHHDDHMTTTFPPIASRGQSHSGGPPRSKFGARKVPLYVKHSYPSVLQTDTMTQQMNQTLGSHLGTATASLPALPGASNNYGLLYNKPETEAEKNMNELWLARRQQEAFQHKYQQQLAVVMDRLALHKSRLESDSLRRQESEAMLKTIQQQALQPHRPTKQSVNESQSRPRGMSDRLRRGMNADGSASPSPSPDGRQSSFQGGRGGNSRKSAANNSNEEGRQQLPLLRPAGSASIIITGGSNSANTNGSVESVAFPARNSVARSSQPQAVRPMKFKIDLPEDYLSRNQHYMQLSDDSDEDNDPDSKRNAAKNSNRRQSSTAPTPSAKKKPSTGNKKEEILFKHDHPNNNERPASAKLFRSVAANDSELKVLYRFQNYRRMPLTTAQEVWLEEREQERHKKSETMARDMFAAAQAKGDKKKDKKDDKKGEKKDKKDKDKSSKSRPGSTGSGMADDKPKPKYKSANHFMNTHFPTFDLDDMDPEEMAPMRAMQLAEVGDIITSCEKYRVHLKESSLRKALVVPVDKPEAICLEGLREDKEGLMVNPLPPDMWRQFKMAKGKKGGKKKKKKGG